MAVGSKALHVWFSGLLEKLFGHVLTLNTKANPLLLLYGGRNPVQGAMQVV